MSPRRFTLEEANALIPLLNQILPQLQDKKRQLDALREELLQFALKMGGDGHILEEQMNELRQEAEKVAAALNSLIERVNELGCQMKDIDMGLVDFPALRQGREVYLCWRLGEDAIRWWHDIDTGYAGRQPLEGPE